MKQQTIIELLLMISSYKDIEELKIKLNSNGDNCHILLEILIFKKNSTYAMCVDTKKEMPNRRFNSDSFSMNKSPIQESTKAPNI